MATFTATNRSRAVVPAPRDDIWGALTDPVVLTRLTPLLRGIDADGDLWHWRMIRLGVLGVNVDASFTERMTFTPTSRIDYVPAPPPASKERAGATGWYELRDVAAGTAVEIALTLHVDLPLARLAAPAVQTVMKGVIQQTGDRFAVNLERHLGVR